MAEQPPAEAPARPPGGDGRRALLLVFTGDGKGKSSAAFGTVMRAVAAGWPVAVVQFLKSGKWQVGEERIARQVGAEWFVAGDGFTWDSTDMDETRAKALAAWEFARDLVASGRHRLIVLDEATYAMTWGWIDTAEVVAALTARPDEVNVVVTGRDAPEALVDVADTVTEMVKRKHAYDAGVMARRGLDY
jgi:cob(I)alamin adenosyltransferase